MIEQGGRGGVADYTGDLVGALADVGVDVELGTACDHQIQLASTVGVRPVFRYVRTGAPLRDWARRVGVSRLVNGLAYLLAVLRLLPAAHRARVVHFQSGEFPPLLAIAFVAMRTAGAAIVFTPHNTFDRGVGWGRAHALCQRLAARVVVHAQADLPQLTAAGAAKAVVIPHGEYGSLAARAGRGDRAATRERLGIPRDAPVALVFGQLRPDKGIADVLAAARRLPELHVLFAGADTGAGQLLRDELASGRLTGRLHVSEGFQPLEDAAHWFAAADVCVLAYRVASQSGVLLLSYAFETPVVVYPVGGLPEAVVDGVTGWITPSADVDALVDSLGSVISGGPAECRRRGSAAAIMAQDRFGWATIARETAATYAAAAAAHRGA